MNGEAFRFVVLTEAVQLYGEGYGAAVRAIRRSAELRERLELARRQAVESLVPLPEPIQAVYREQVRYSESVVRHGDFSLLQRYGGQVIPLVSQDWTGTVELPAPPTAILPGLLDPVSHDAGVLEAIREIPDLVGHLDMVDGQLLIFAPDAPTLAALIVTLHEVGHFLYEVRSGRSVNLPFQHYAESEAAAIAFCDRGIRRYLRLYRPDQPELSAKWAAYQSAELLLNHYFFLEEAGLLGLHPGHLPHLSMTYLRDNWMKSFGYQVVYAVASRLAADHAEEVLGRAS
jgi:hypothetical protein